MPAKKTTPGKKLLADQPGLKHANGHTNGTAKNGVHANGVKTVLNAGGDEAPAKAKKKKTQEKTPKKAGSRKTTVKSTAADIITIEFRLRFHTSFGETLYIMGDHPLLGEMDEKTAAPLSFLDNETWHVRMEIPASDKPLQYHYLLKQKDGTVQYDWGLKTFDPTAFRSKDVLVIDSWNHAGYFENVFYTEPFRNVLLPQIDFSAGKPPRTFTHRFMVKAPLLGKGEVLCMMGNHTALQNWDTARPLLLNKKKEDDHWQIDIDLPGIDSIEYKYGVFDTATKTFVRYEGGRNRYAGPATNKKQVSIDDGFAILPNDTWKGAGIAIPVFSLRTENSFGVGEFSDLKLLVDWAKKVDLKMIQVLPVNDTSATHSWKDSYPYAAISAFALHPIFLNLEKLVLPKNSHLLHQLDKKRKELNAAPTVNYCGVIKEKLAFIEQVFPLQKAATFKKKDFKEFFRANEHWLVPYAVFCYLRDEYGTSDFNQWPGYKRYDEVAVTALAAEGASHDKINIHFFIQYHLHLQLKEATEYAHANNIIVKGDIPIGIYRYGADAWQHPELYHMDVQAGAPPDDFAVKGQNWGFPTYNWERMLQDGFKWWRQRFEQMSYYFDAFRIDHILGFFRIWSIPLDSVEGIMGRFVPAIAVHVNEFAAKGVHFDYSRLCRPFITENILHETFGVGAEAAKQFLNYDGFERYTLKNEFNTQRKIEQYFLDKEDQQLKEGLYNLLSNVILFEEEGSEGTKFHFRFGMQDTASFRHLDPHTQHVLQQLYVNYFFERQDQYWKNEAMQKLPGLKRATNMLVCGEDLGLVPHCVPDVMQQLGILSLEIQRMPKAANRQFFHPSESPYLSVVTPSTHDMSTVRGWWEEDRGNTQKFYNTELNQPGEAPLHCEPWINKAIVLQHLYSPAIWSIFQVQDLLGMSGELRRADPSEERINLPSDPQHYWNYRVHIPLEDLLKADEFNMELKEYIRSSGRN